jgi:hypothetical protein
MRGRITATVAEGAYLHLDRHSVMRVTCHGLTVLQRGLCNAAEQFILFS